MDLAKTQFISLVTKGITTALGIIQSIIVIRLLNPAEFGLVGLVMSIGGVIGVSQHLGIVDGAIREIAVLKNKRDIGKVFWVSHLTRQLVTIPLSLGLIVLADMIAVDIYHRPEIAPYIKLFAAVLILQGLQDVFGATLTGMKKFGALYAVQVITALINIAVFGYLTWQYGTAGFFWAIIVTTGIMVALFTVITLKTLGAAAALPSWQDIKSYGQRVMRIGAFMYVSRIAFVVWQRLPLLLLGGVLAAEELGYLNVSLTFGSKLTIIAMALSEVNLSWMSSLFATQQHEFRRVVTRNMHRVLMLMALLTLVLLFFTPEILQYIVGPEYLPAEPMILIMTLAFFLYSLTDIGTSSIFVSADNPRLRAGVYAAMTAVSAACVGLLLITRPDPLLATYAVLAGAVVSYVGMIFFARRRFRINLLPLPLAGLLVALSLSVWWLAAAAPSLPWRIAVFVALAVYIIAEAHRSKLLPPMLVRHLKLPRAARGEEDLRIICFAGAAYDQLSWTNRQHMMSRVSQRYPVLYVEPRVWVARYMWRHRHNPRAITAFLRRIFWYERKHERLFIKAQWNLIPGSREFKAIALFNHFINRYLVLGVASFLHFNHGKVCLWIYDTEAAEYLGAWRQATVLYDCVDDHAAQAGAERNPRRVDEEERQILRRADVVTTTSKKLYELKRFHNRNTHLVLNAGDVDIFLRGVAAPASAALTTLQQLPHPLFGSVGALDAYKLDVTLLHTIARARPSWHFVFIGAPVIDHNSTIAQELTQLPNIHVLSAVPHEQVPAYVRHFDVCLIPYKQSRYNAASFPLKFWEFMATGKPIIVSGLPELQEYQPLIGYAKTAEEFITLGERWLSNPTKERDQRIAHARKHSWPARVEAVLTLLLAAVSHNKAQ